MANYDANIRIGVTGQQQLDAAITRIRRLQKAVSAENKFQVTFDRGVAQSLDNYNNALRKAANLINSVGAGTKLEAAAIQQYVSALNEANAARSRQNKLIEEEIAKRNQLRNIEVLKRENRVASLARPAGSANALSAERRKAEQQLDRAAPGTEAETKAVNRLTAAIEAENKALERRNLLLGREPTGGAGGRVGRQLASPIGGLESIPGSPAARKARRERITRGIQESAIGGAFPLLFGAGPFSSAGGLIGGAAGALGPGAGFAGGLVGSLLGQQLDTIRQNASGLAEALKTPSDALAAMEASGIKVSGALKNTVAALEDTGRAADAQALVLKELERLGGTEYVQNLLALDEANKRLASAWSQLSVDIQRELIPAFVVLANGIAGIVELINRNKTLFEVLAALGKSAVAATGLGAIPVLIGEAGKAGAKNAPGNRQPPPVDDTRQRKALDAQASAIGFRRQQAQELLSLENSVVDMRREAEEKILELRRRGADIELEKTRLRESIEDEIFRRRQEVARLQAENTRSRQQLGIESTDLALAQRAEQIGGPGAELLDRVREYLRIKGEGEANLQLREKQIQLEIAQDKREVSKFELQVADRVRAINRQVEDYSRDVTTFELNTERKIGEYKIKVEEYLYKEVERRYQMAASYEAKRAAAAALGGFDVGPGTGQGGGAFSKWDPALLRGTAAIDRKYGVPTGSTASLFMFESGGSTSVQRGDNGATGLFQVMPATARELGTTVDQIKNMGGLQQLVLFDRYLQNRGFRPGMSVQQMYATVLGGNPSAGGRDSNGTTPGSGAAVIRGYIPSAAAAIAAAGVPAGPGALAAQAPMPGPAARPPAPPSLPSLPQAPAPVGFQDLSAIVRAQEQKNEELQKELEIQRQLEAVKASGALLALTSNRQARDRLIAAQEELLGARSLLDLNTSLSDQEQERQRVQLENAAAANTLEQALADSVTEARSLYESNVLSKEVFLQILGNLQERKNLEEEILKDKEAQLLIEQEQARNAIAGNNIRELNLAGRGASRGLYGGGLEKYNEAFSRTGNEAFAMEQARVGRAADLRGQIGEIQANLNQLTDPAQAVITQAKGIGDAFATAFTDITSGSKSAKEALSDMFKSVANSFLNMAAQILAQQAVLGILGMFGFGGGPAIGGGGGGGLLTGSGILNSNIFGGGFSIPNVSYFAEGGYVAGPTPAVVGDGGEGEYMIPTSKMAAAMTRYSAGARGDAVLQGPDGIAAGDDGGGGWMEPTINVTTGSVLRFEGADYVRQEDFQAGLRTATLQGAKMGEQRTLRRMQQSPGTRRRLGL